MKSRIHVTITRQTVGYAIFTLIALMVFAYLRFPGDVFARYLAAVISDVNPEAVLLVESVKPSLLPGLMLENVTLGFRDAPQATLRAETITVGPAWPELLKARSTVSFRVTTYGGTMHGSAKPRRFLAFDGPLDWSVTLNGIDIGKIGYLRGRLNAPLAGNLSGVLTFSGPIRSLQTGAGAFECTVVNGSYQLRNRIMGMDRLDFRKIDAVMAIRNGVLTINRLRLTGDKINGVLSGDIAVNGADIGSSQIRLNFAFELAGQNRKMSLVMTGTLSNPLIKLI